MKLNIFYLNGSVTITGENLFLVKEMTKEQFETLYNDYNSGLLTTELLNEYFLDRQVIDEQNAAATAYIEKVNKWERLFELNQDRYPLSSKDGAVFYKGIPHSMTPTILNAFVQAFENNDTLRLDALRNFWLLVSRNPNDRTRKDLDGWVERGNFQLASNGWIVGYRGANILEPRNYALQECIKSSVQVAHSWKKALVDYAIHTNGDKGYILRRAYVESPDTLVGNLQELSDNIRKYDGLFTDHYSHKFRMRVGEFVNEPNCVDDPTETCGPGLHFCNVGGSHQYYYGYFGNQYQIVLVNPRYVRALPIDYHYNKARTTQYYFLDTLQADETGHFIVPEKYSGQVIMLDEETLTKLKENDFNEMFELLQEELTSGQIQLGDITKVMNPVEFVEETTFAKILDKIEAVDNLTVEKRHMDVYTREDFQRLYADLDEEYDEVEEEENEYYDYGKYWTYNENEPDAEGTY